MNLLVMAPGEVGGWPNLLVMAPGEVGGWVVDRTTPHARQVGGWVWEARAGGWLVGWVHRGWLRWRQV